MSPLASNLINLFVYSIKKLKYLIDIMSVTDPEQNS